MAFEQGTATDHVDLYNKLYTFVTSHPDLVAANQQWERVTTVGSAPPFAWGVTTAPDAGDGSVDDGGFPADLMLKGRGLAGQDEVFVALRLVTRSGTQRAGFYVRGYFGVDESVNGFNGHINPSLAVGVPLWFNQAMSYWFVANGRRFGGVVNAGGVYMSFYAGLYLPYATPAGNPYPLAIGGNMRGDRTFDDTWVSSTGNYFGSFVDPWSGSSSTLSGSSLQVVGPEGGWNIFCNAGGYDSPVGTRTNDTGYTGVHPFGSAVLPRSLAYASDRDVAPPGYGAAYRYLRACYLRAQTPLLGGGYLLTPLTLFASRYHTNLNVPAGVWGILDGFHQVAGLGNTAENIVTVGGVDHLVAPITYRTENDCFFTMALE